MKTILLIIAMVAVALAIIQEIRSKRRGRAKLESEPKLAEIQLEKVESKPANGDDLAKRLERFYEAEQKLAEKDLEIYGESKPIRYDELIPDLNRINICQGEAQIFAFKPENPGEIRDFLVYFGEFPSGQASFTSLHAKIPELKKLLDLGEEPIDILEGLQEILVATKNAKSMIRLDWEKDQTKIILVLRGL